LWVKKPWAMKKRILVAEDDAALARVLRDNLASQGFVVDWVDGGDLVEDRAREFAPDLVILDVMLPGKSGFDLVRSLKERSRTAVVLLTARSQRADILEGLYLGADDYITKPFGMDELLARMRAALRHQLQVHGERPIFRTGDLSVDLVRRIVKVADRDVKLSPKEYDLLRVLVQHAGKVLTHKFLLGELWDSLTDAQYLRVYVRQLRQKIEADPERPHFVLTETGIGYRLRAPD
jgi:two-component system, OmpR family, KDP operon response regulator KdpE